jgi:hypothetical protein
MWANLRRGSGPTDQTQSDRFVDVRWSWRPIHRVADLSSVPNLASRRIPEGTDRRAFFKTMRS